MNEVVIRGFTPHGYRRYVERITPKVYDKIIKKLPLEQSYGRTDEYFRDFAKKHTSYYDVLIDKLFEGEVCEVEKIGQINTHPTSVLYKFGRSVLVFGARTLLIITAYRYSKAKYKIISKNFKIVKPQYHR